LDDLSSNVCQSDLREPPTSPRGIGKISLEIVARLVIHHHRPSGRVFSCRSTLLSLTERKPEEHRDRNSRI